MSDEPVSIYHSQLKQSHRGESIGWQNCCAGHSDIYKAIACHDNIRKGIESGEGSPLGIMLRQLDGIAAGEMVFELRVVKITVATDIIEAATTCSIKKSA